MPPRYAYWTILVGDSPTAFRAARPEELRPTFERLREKHPDVVMKWFARGRLWNSPAEAQQASHRRERPAETRGRDWRPGGDHRDPRERFKKPRGTHPARAKKRWPREGPPGPAPGQEKGARPAAGSWRPPSDAGRPTTPRGRKPPPKWTARPEARASRPYRPGPQEKPGGSPPGRHPEWRGDRRPPDRRRSGDWRAAGQGGKPPTPGGPKGRWTGSSRREPGTSDPAFEKRRRDTGDRGSGAPDSSRRRQDRPPRKGPPRKPRR